MNKTIINNLNEVCKEKDTLFFLGDFCFGNNIDVEHFRLQIKCKNIIYIYGNHDKTIRESHYLQSFFTLCTDFLDCKIHPEYGLSKAGHPFTLTHYAMKVWNKSHHGAYNLYGHSHGSLKDDPNSLSFDCGVDCFNFKPVSYNQVEEIMNKKTWKPIDHHGGSV